MAIDDDQVVVAGTGEPSEVREGEQLVEAGYDGDSSASMASTPAQSRTPASHVRISPHDASMRSWASSC
ncbi:MAG: hypothetical protein R2699_19535 [Acidimicrobiales bacterium]